MNISTFLEKCISSKGKFISPPTFGKNYVRGGLFLSSKSISKQKKRGFSKEKFLLIQSPNNNPWVELD